MNTASTVVTTIFSRLMMMMMMMLKLTRSHRYRPSNDSQIDTIFKCLLTVDSSPATPQTSPSLQYCRTWIFEGRQAHAYNYVSV
jgi:hypothetical protein